MGYTRYTRVYPIEDYGVTITKSITQNYQSICSKVATSHDLRIQLFIEKPDADNQLSELTVKFEMYYSIFGRPYYRSSLWYTVSSVCLSSVTFCIVAKRYDLAKSV